MWVVHSHCTRNKHTDHHTRNGYRECIRVCVRRSSRKYNGVCMCVYVCVYLPSRRIRSHLKHLKLHYNPLTWNNLKQSYTHYNSFQVYGGRDNSAPSLVSLCHHQTHPIVLTTQGNRAFVSFNSDQSVRGRGFNISYNTLPHGLLLTLLFFIFIYLFVG